MEEFWQTMARERIGVSSDRVHALPTTFLHCFPEDPSLQVRHGMPFLTSSSTISVRWLDFFPSRGSGITSPGSSQVLVQVFGVFFLDFFLLL